VTDDRIDHLKIFKAEAMAVPASYEHGSPKVTMTEEGVAMGGFLP
jgi:hypothetical protein